MKPIFFIYQFGFKQISLPPESEEKRGEILKIRMCENGCYIQTEIDVEVALEKLNQFIGRKVIGVLCDSNQLEDEGEFLGGKLTKGEYGHKVILLRIKYHEYVEYIEI